MLNLMGIRRSQGIVAQACLKRHIRSFILLIMQIIEERYDFLSKNSNVITEFSDSDTSPQCVSDKCNTGASVKLV